MQKLILILLLASVLYADMAPKAKDNSDFNNWKAKHGIHFQDSEHKYRLFLYRQRQAEIKAHNENPENTYKKGENQFSAMTFEEF